MKTDRELMQQALEALKLIDEAMPFPVAKLTIKNLSERLAQPEREPDDIASILACRNMLDAQPVPEVDRVIWPCLIDSADFSENTITLAMQCEDYKVSAGTHYLSTTPPQRTEPPQKKVWTFWDLSGGDITDAIKAKIKEKNGGHSAS